MSQNNEFLKIGDRVCTGRHNIGVLVGVYDNWGWVKTDDGQFKTIKMGELKRYEELKPYWYDQKLFRTTCLHDGRAFATANHKTANVESAHLLVRMFRYASLIQSLRDSLGCGCDVFDPGKLNFVIYWDFTGGWQVAQTHSRSGHVDRFYFHSREDARAVVDYLQKHYPGGYSSI